MLAITARLMIANPPEITAFTGHDRRFPDRPSRHDLGCRAGLRRGGGASAVVRRGADHHPPPRGRAPSLVAGPYTAMTVVGNTRRNRSGVTDGRVRGSDRPYPGVPGRNGVARRTRRSGRGVDRDRRGGFLVTWSGLETDSSRICQGRWPGCGCWPRADGSSPPPNSTPCGGPCLTMLGCC